MPVYTFECDYCDAVADLRVAVGDRDKVQNCSGCSEWTMYRRFTPTAHVLVPEHFRHDQSQFQPQAWDTAAWEARSKGNMSHAPAKPGADFGEHLERDLRGTWG